MHNRRSIGRAFLGATAFAAISVALPAAAQHIDSIVAFGDSYADDGNAITMLLASPFVDPATKPQLQQVYRSGRFRAVPITSTRCRSPRRPR